MSLSYGLVSYYKLQGHAEDYSPNEIDGTIGGTPSTVSGIIGDCLSLDGIGDYILLGADPCSLIVQAGGSFSISNWFKTTYVTTGSSDLRALWAINSAAGGNKFWCWCPNYNRSDSMVINDVDGEESTTPNPCNDNAWHHVVFTQNGATKKCKAYYDGASLGQDFVSLRGIASDDVISIGQEYDAAVLTDFYEGEADEFGIWNWELSPEHVSALYNGGDGLPFEDFSTTYPEFENENSKQAIRPYWIVDIEGLPNRYVHRG